LLHRRYSASSLVWTDPSLYSASVLSPLWGCHLEFSLGIGVEGSHVPQRSLSQARAAFVPATIWTVSRSPPDSSQGNNWTLVSMASLRFRHIASDSLSFAFLTLT
jgi:hypothetical protein